MLEMIHAMSLMHDDLHCMDNDDLCHSRLSNHKVFSEHAAVLASYAAFEHIVTMTVGMVEGRIAHVIGKIVRLIGSEGVVTGQVVDL